MKCKQEMLKKARNADTQLHHHHLPILTEIVYIFLRFAPQLFDIIIHIVLLSFCGSPAFKAEITTANSDKHS